MVSGDHKSAAQPRDHLGGDTAATARHGGTVVTNTTAPGHTSAVRGRSQAGGQPGKHQDLPEATAATTAPVTCGGE